MLEHVPRWLGAALRGARAGAEKIAVAQAELGGSFGAIDLSSPAFGHEARLPERFTADGAGVSPPLVWGPLPEGTFSLTLLVEDADAPAPQPLVHAVVGGMPGDTHRIVEGAIVRDGDGGAAGDVGRNSFFGEGWLPPDPPTDTASTATPFNCSRSMTARATPARVRGVARSSRRWRGMSSRRDC